MSDIKKTGASVNDTMWVRREGKEGYQTDTFIIHFPSTDYTNPNGGGVTVTMDVKEFKELDKLIDRRIHYICPKCGGECRPYRQREMDSHELTCYRCNWSESD